MTDTTGVCCKWELTDKCFSALAHLPRVNVWKRWRIPWALWERLTCGRAQSALDEIGRWVKEGTQVKGWHVKSFDSMISDRGVSVEAGPCVHIELPISCIKHVGDAMSLESPFVFGCVPKGKNYNYLCNQTKQMMRIMQRKLTRGEEGRWQAVGENVDH